MLSAKWIPSRLKNPFDSSRKRAQVDGAAEAETDSDVISSRSAIPQSRSLSPFSTPSSISSQKYSSLSVNRTSSPSPPWQAWTLDQDFLKQVYDWNEHHPEKTLDRILNGICTSIERNKDLMELVPDGPIPFRGFIKALAHLVKLGTTMIEAKVTALQFTREILHWVEKLASAFRDSEGGPFVSQTWEDLTEIRKLIEEVCAWAHKMLNCTPYQRTSIKDEIFQLQKKFSDATQHFEILSGISLARGQDALLRGQDGLLRGQDGLLRGQDVILRGQDNLAQMMQKNQPPPTIPDATYEYQKKYPCDPGTREKFLGEIMEWIGDISGATPSFFWMSGDPGVGKSAITASITKECKRRRVLWAQFFINRNDARTVDPQLFFPSIAKQMAASSHAVDHAIQEVLKAQPYLMSEDISKDQAIGLFINTILVASESCPTSPVVIVIDALDETDIKRLGDTAQVFSQVFVNLPRNAKVFISSRVETVIRDNFAPETNAWVWHMHLSAEKSIVEVTKFLEGKVAQIMKEHHLNWAQWGKERMKKLCTQASGLFIWAVTAIAYIRAQIEESGTECLDTVLDELNANGMHNIEMLYLTILKRTYQGESGPWRYQRFQRIMGAILVQQSPLCIDDLKGLLNLRNPRNHAPADVEHFVRRLRTILVAGAREINGRTIPRAHRSFSDFVTSAGAEDFRIDPINSDGELAIQCIRQLDRLCELRDSAQPELGMPAQLPYAVLHWSSHLTRVVGVKAEEAETDGDSLSTNAENIISESENNLNTDTLAGVGVTEKRNQTPDDVCCIAVSPDARHIAFGQVDGSIQLRDLQTGDEMLPAMLGHTGTVFFIAFSPDQTRLSSASRDNTIRIWNSITGVMVLGPLVGHSSEVYCTVFSPDGRRIVSASYDQTIRIWNSDTGEMVLGPLQGHTAPVMSAAFSPDGRHIVSASNYHTIHIRNSETGDMVLGLQGDSSSLRFAFFSADGSHIISGSRDRTILVWDSHTGERLPALPESDADARLTFTDSETAPYIRTPPRPLQGTSTTESYCFRLGGERRVVGGVVNSGIDTWLYVNRESRHSKFIAGRYLGQLILLIS